MSFTVGPIEIPLSGNRVHQIGMLESFAIRWRDYPSGAGIAVVPFDRFFTGRIPGAGEYPFPYMSLIVGAGGRRWRSDKYEGVRRTASLHVFVDPARLEEGEEIMEIARRVYCNQAWRYDWGDIIDVLDGGPPTPRQINEPTLQYWELVKLMTLCIRQKRVDTPVCCSGASQGSNISSGISPFPSSSRSHSSV